MLYFAYGSNMNWQQMLERCPSACFIGIATLPNHKLAFTRKSDNRRCGVADAVFEQGQVLWGVVYEITAPDIEKLDSSEGYREGRNKNSYLRRECKVWLDGIGLQPLSVFIYFADRQPNPPLPSIDYKTLLLSGARHWHLPNEYVRGPEAIKVSG